MKKWVCGVCGWIYDEAAGDPDYDLAPGVRRVEKLPRALSGYWVRFVSSSACVATAALAYE